MPRNDLKNGHLICFPFKLNVKQRKDGSSVTKNSALYRNTYMLNLKVEFNYSTFSIEDFSYSTLSVEVSNFQFSTIQFYQLKSSTFNNLSVLARSEGRG